MSQQLLIFLGESVMSPIQWGVVEDERLLEAGRIPGAEALGSLRRRQQETEKTIAFLPGEQAALRHMETPPKTAAKFKAAAAYLLEDDLSEPLEQIHYATQFSSNGGFILAIRDEIIQNWVDIFAAANLEVDVLTTDANALANISDDIILLRGNRGPFQARRQRRWRARMSCLTLLAPSFSMLAATRASSVWEKNRNCPFF